MKNNAFIYTLCILLLFALKLSSQSGIFRQLTTKNGLPSNNVYGVIKDDQGFIWAYTEKGIAKFNGYDFKKFSIEDGLPVNDIFNINKSKDGLLWLLGIENTLAYIQNDTIFPVDLNNDEKIVLKNNSNEPWYRSEYHRWKTKDGYLEKEKILDRINLTKIFTEGAIYLLEPKNKNEAFGINIEDQSFVTLNKSTVLSTVKLKSKITNACLFNSINYIESSSPYFVIVNHVGFTTINEKSKEQILYPWSQFFDPDKKIIRANVHIENSTVSISTNEGLIIISNINDIKSYRFPELSRTHTIQRVYIDDEDNIWISTKDNGLYFYSADQAQTKIFLPKNTLDNNFKKIYKTKDGEIICVSSKGNLYNPKTENQIKINKPKANLYNSFLTDDEELILLLEAQPLMSISLNENKDESQPIDSRLLKHNEKQQENIFQGPLNIQKNIKQIATRNPQDIYVNHGFGFLRLHLDEKGESKLTPISNRQRLVFKFPNSNDVYTADKDKLYLIEDDVELDPILELPLITSILPFENKGLLVGTESSGLYKFLYADKQLEKIGNWNSISKIQLKPSGEIFISTNTGIHKIASEENNHRHIKNWGLNQGLPNLEVDDFLVDKNKLYACTNNGVAIIDLEYEQEQKINIDSKLRLEAVKINNQRIEQGANLKHKQNDLSVSFKLLDLKSFGDIKYRYKLEPIQKQWQNTRDTNIVFNNLASNEYTFHLEAFDSDNQKYELAQSFNFQIGKPFWKTLVFLLLAILTLGLITLSIDIRRRKSLEEKLKLSKIHNKRIANLKLEALRSQMNPHFVFNSLGAIQYYIQTHKIEEADNYLSLFANLMRKYLNSSSEQLISLHDEISLINDYIKLEEMRFEGMFETEINIDPNIDLNNTYIPSMMIQPYVENSVNHGIPNRKDGQAKIMIKIYPQDTDQIKIEINDNGIGRENAKKYKKRFHKSKGMQNVIKRIESLKAAELVNIDINIKNNSNDNCFPGTSVVITLKNFMNGIHSSHSG